MTLLALRKRSKAPKRVELHEIGSMLRQVTRDYGIPGYRYYALAKAISEDFGVICTAEDVKGYDELHVQEEDYKLESRRLTYGLQNRLGQMF